ncbi:MAG: Hpt domain-containing protein [Treponema sp.]|nr:Hpt domain-containing protein [Treponema sp.]
MSNIVKDLEAQGCNMKEALERFLGNQAILEKMLVKFPDSLKPLEVLSFIDENDIEQATANAHTIKGITGNLSLTPLYTAYSEIVNLLRAGDSTKAKEILLNTLPIQQNLIKIIQNG